MSLRNSPLSSPTLRFSCPSPRLQSGFPAPELLTPNAPEDSEAVKSDEWETLRAEKYEALRERRGLLIVVMIPSLLYVANRKKLSVERTARRRFADIFDRATCGLFYLLVCDLARSTPIHWEGATIGDIVFYTYVFTAFHLTSIYCLSCVTGNRGRGERNLAGIASVLGQSLESVTRVFVDDWQSRCIGSASDVSLLFRRVFERFHTCRGIHRHW